MAFVVAWVPIVLGLIVFITLSALDFKRLWIRKADREDSDERATIHPRLRPLTRVDTTGGTPAPPTEEDR